MPANADDFEHAFDVAYDEANEQFYIKKWRGPGSIVFRRATAQHRLEVEPGQSALSIFIMGRKTQDWGFYTPSGKVYWRTYLGLEEARP